MRGAALGVAGLLALSASVAIGAADPEAAQRQYRIARRLAAEGSPEAAAALRKVVELDPDGPLVDDALVDEAMLADVPRWPEELGQIDILAARDAVELLDRAIAARPDEDRIAEARYHRGLLRLEPQPGHDASAARLDLAEVATAGASVWSTPARYALAWLHENQGSDDRALDAYQRLVVDFPHSDAAARARVGLARLQLRRDRPGQAARWLQQAIESGVTDAVLAEQLRELAVREILRKAQAVDRVGSDFNSVRIPTGVRAFTGMVPVSSGGLLLADRREARVVELAESGEIVARWDLADPQAVAVSPLGTRFAASDDFVYRLDDRGRSVRVSALGEFGPLSGLAADGQGGLWLLGRRGQRLGYVRPGSAGPRPYWEDRNFKLQAPRWDGRRLVAIDSRSRTVVAFAEDGTPRILSGGSIVRPTDLAADLAGRLAVLDPKGGQVVLLAPDGTVIATSGLEAVGVPDAVAVGLGFDGALHLFGGTRAEWVRLP